MSVTIQHSVRTIQRSSAWRNLIAVVSVPPTAQTTGAIANYGGTRTANTVRSLGIIGLAVGAIILLRAPYAFAGNAVDCGIYQPGSLQSQLCTPYNTADSHHQQFGELFAANQVSSSSPSSTQTKWLILDPPLSQPITGSQYSASGNSQLQGALAINVDQSGNVWIGDGNQGVYELVGAAWATNNPLVNAVNIGFTP
jgi:hypothetical protein